VPNYFGEQRFGREAGNLVAVWSEAEKLASASQDGERGGRPRRGGDDRGFMLSAARSLIFNAILGERVRDGSWNQLSPGDVANLDGRGSVFAVEAVDAALAARCAAMEIHPTAPLAGEEDSLASAGVREMEQSVAARFPEALAVIRAARMNGERRALRIRVRDLDYALTEGVLTVRFALAAGSFATTVLREIIAGASGE
jgi:tRNA pseudouridine13 synthase